MHLKIIHFQTFRFKKKIVPENVISKELSTFITIELPAVRAVIISPTAEDSAGTGLSDSDHSASVVGAGNPILGQMV